jgi:hypothetical protein
MDRYDVIVIGGGASGILAAIRAKECGASVLIIEKNPRIGKKILATGNGRCNYTNTNALPADYNDPKFVTPALERFGPGFVISFFRQLGIEPRVEELGKAFPMSEQASSILDVLLYRVDTLKIPVIAEAPVTEIRRLSEGFSVLTPKGVWNAKRLILATGGKAFPQSGSDGSGYCLAQNLGHRLSPIFPSLVKLRLESPFLKGLDGVKIDGKVQLLHKGAVLREEIGDILFTSFGISGPTILQLSRQANQLCMEGQTPWIKVVLIPSLSYGAIQARFRSRPDIPVDFSLVGLIHKRLIPALLKEAGVTKLDSPVSSISNETEKRILDLLFDWRFPVLGSRGFEEAQVTAGGIELDEVHRETLESRKCSGLFFAGEILDVDARCGGYNLQWAWASGLLAGESAASH